MILAELNTHNAISKNTRSTRAVPTNKLIAEDIYVPNFMRNKPGMQATEHFPDEENLEIQKAWLEFAKQTQVFSDSLVKAGVHKQWAGRPLEWFGYCDTLLTATDWKNFFTLRCHEDAQPEIQNLACKIRDSIQASSPTQLRYGDFHLPYIEISDIPLAEKYIQDNPGKLSPFYSAEYALNTILAKISVARCARISYSPFDGNGSVEKEIERFDKLVVSKPVHASPAEHVAICRDIHLDGLKDANFRGWTQYRSLIPGNVVPG